MKVVILAGGFGTRLSEYTKRIPKPMVKIGKDPNIISYNKTLYEIWFLNDFIIAGGYKCSIINNYFKRKKN